mmetsp:Transcript_9685/g.18180  ORF Transcript_9685/g.18180 Transcript_9685/m.18180 type:complete len:762 (-) Transcript_9685:77-2362(-)
MGVKASKLEFQEEDQVAENYSNTNTCQRDTSDTTTFKADVHCVLTEGSLVKEENMESHSKRTHSNVVVEDDNVDYDFSYSEDLNDGEVVTNGSEFDETFAKSNVKVVDPYFDDGNEDSKMTCSPNTCGTAPSSKILLPFRSCNDLLARNFTSSNYVEAEDRHDSHSEGEILDKVNLKRRRKYTAEKDMLSKRLSSYSLLPIVFSTDPLYNEHEILMEDGDLPTELSDLRPKFIMLDGRHVQCRSFHVITTAALPWMTGTAINPLLRAAYLNKMNRTAVEKAIGQTCTPMVFEMMGRVTLVVPWLNDTKDQRILYGDDMIFSSRKQQELYIREWLRTSANLPLEADLESGGIHISFYDARYISELKSIVPVGKICEHIDSNHVDVCILDEPEHLNFLSMSDPEPFPSLFRHVVGIMHTNYVAYLKGHVVGIVVMPVASVMMSLTTRYHCHRIVKLSDTLQVYAKEKECVMNVHGIRQEFFEIGNRRKLATLHKGKIYYIGKLLWAKGLDTIIELEYAFKSVTGDYFPIDIIGSGPEEEEIRRAFHGRKAMSSGGERSCSESDYDVAIKRSSSMKDKMDKFMNEIPKSRFELRKHSIPSTFLGRMDHASLGDGYKIFVNPSETEVLCTTTAEAIAMGKFVIIPQHPSNHFFEQFPNCLTYTSKAEFVSQLQYALINEPPILSDALLYLLTWEAATERLIEASIITKREAKRRERERQTDVDQKAADYVKSGIFETFRKYVLKSMRDADADEDVVETEHTPSDL